MDGCLRDDGRPAPGVVAPVLHGSAQPGWARTASHRHLACYAQGLRVSVVYGVPPVVGGGLPGGGVAVCEGIEQVGLQARLHVRR